MKTGDEVKAFVKIGMMRKPDWRIGTYVRQNELCHEVELHGIVHPVEIGKVKLWEPVKHENGTFPAIDKFVEDNWGELKQIVTDSVKNFFPNEKVDINEENRQITVADITIAGAVREVESIARISELPCWSVITFKTIPATHWEPEDVDEVLIAQAPSNMTAAKALIDAVWNFKSSPYWENLNDSKFAQDLQEDY